MGHLLLIAEQNTKMELNPGTNWVFHQPLLILIVWQSSHNCTSKPALYATVCLLKCILNTSYPYTLSLSLSLPYSLPNRLAALNITCTRPMNKQGQGQAVLKHAASFRRQEPWVIHELGLRKRKKQGKSVTVYFQLAHKVCSNTTRLVKGKSKTHLTLSPLLSQGTKPGR